MIKKLMLTLSALTLCFGAFAQSGRTCATDEFHKQQVALHPEIRIDEARLKADIERYMKGQVATSAGHMAGTASKTAIDSSGYTAPWPADNAQYHIPMVVHVIYEGATSSSTTLTDNDIYKMVDRLNTYYNQTDPALGGIINPFKPYVGNAHMTFHLANKDPQGKPTRGIVRAYSYSSNYGDESAKFDQWPPDQYLNLYLINVIGKGTVGGTVLAYATFPTDYGSNPYSQGVISRADQASITSGGNIYTVAHEIGHFMYLYHVWNSNGKGAEEMPPYVPGSVATCGDDEVDDTPPTYGHFYTGCSKLYDTACATGYFKDYDSTTFYTITGDTGIIASNRLRIDSMRAKTKFSSSATNVIGQSFTTKAVVTPLQSISVFVDTANTGAVTTMTLLNAAGALIVGNSVNTQTTNVTPVITYNFSGVVLNPNTTYRFRINRVSGSDSFKVFTDTINKYPGGQLYTGAGANTPISGSDLYFVINQLRRIDYPDTANTQNIMDYSSCTSEMFTKGQVGRMRAAIRSDVGLRYKLISDANLAKTGILDTVTKTFIAPKDITPTALFTVSRNFTCAGSTTPITFTNRSYNDTTDVAAWTFDKGASNATSSNTVSVGNTFNEIGWVNASLTVTGNNTPGSSTYTRKDLVYVADPVGTTPYFEEFTAGSAKIDQYPIFNYFDNPNYRWELYDKAGFYDKTCIRFKNFDVRDEVAVTQGLALNTAAQSPRGLYADFFTPAFDLSNFTGNCFMDFLSAGSFRTTKTSYMNDSLLISYSTDCGSSWRFLTKLKYAELANNGYQNTEFEPSWYGSWKEHSYDVPLQARTNATYFRFRYNPGTDNAYLKYGGLDFGTGNNFYMDRLHITSDPLGVENGVIVKLGMTVMPNPTNGAATIRLNGGDNSEAQVNVTDVTGKLVYRTSAIRKAITTEIEIPATALRVKGMYLVHVITNGATETQKLVVY